MVIISEENHENSQENTELKGGSQGPFITEIKRNLIGKF
jgi:hypothetical protein